MSDCLEFSDVVNKASETCCAQINVWSDPTCNIAEKY